MMCVCVMGDFVKTGEGRSVPRLDRVPNGPLSLRIVGNFFRLDYID